MKDGVPPDVRVKWAELDKQFPRAKIFEILERENKAKRDAKEALKEIPDLIDWVDYKMPKKHLIGFSIFLKNRKESTLDSKTLRPLSKEIMNKYHQIMERIKKYGR